MTSNAKCWTPPAAAPLIAMLWLTASAMAGFDARAPCPPVVEYSRSDQTRAAAEIEAMSASTVVVGMLGDNTMLRDQLRACKRENSAHGVSAWQKAHETWALERSL